MNIVSLSIIYSIIALLLVFLVAYKKYNKLVSPVILISTVFSFGIIFVFLIIIGEAYMIYDGTGKLAMDVTGQVGDFVGGVIGTLLLGISIILLYNTFIEQKLFSRTQTKYLAENEIAQKKQQFETAFFQLLNSHNNLKQAIQFNTKDRLTWWSEEQGEPERIVSGLEFFEFAKWDFHRLYQPEGQIIPAISIRQNDLMESLLPNPPTEHGMDQPILRIKSKYKKFFDTYHNYLGHYFRNIYYILKYIDNHFEDDVKQNIEKREDTLKKYKFYTGTLQSQMSSSELLLLFYNGICFTKMNNLIIKYNMLSNLAIEDLADSNGHSELYVGVTLKTRNSIIEDNPLS